MEPETQKTPQELTDEQLRETQELARRSAGLNSDGSNHAVQTERTEPCGRCVPVRGVSTPNQLRQTLDLAIGIWEPPMCRACFAFNEARQLEIDSDRAAKDALARIDGDRSRMRNTGIPEPYVVGKRGYLDLDNGPKTASYQKARGACHNLITGQLSAPWIFLCGENGTFKSTLACCALLMGLQAGLVGRYEFWPNTLNELRGLNRDDAPEPVARYIDRLVRVPRLVFDEVGFGTPTNFAVETLGVIFERRYQLDSAAEPGQRWMIFTSNRTVEQLVKSFAPFDDFLMAPRLERRIAEMSTEILIEREAS